MNFIEKIKRQVEILVLCSSNNNKITCADLAWRFKVEEITIKRDLNYLRSIGFDIHSTKKEGIKIFKTANDTLLKDLVVEYIALSCQKYSQNILNWLSAALNNLNCALCYVTLQHCVSRNILVKIKYKSNYNINCEEFRVCPLSFKQINDKMVLIASKYGQPTDFYLDNIISAEALE
jgi:NADH/NAD ratio-sensing transcriptional regulator Rex